MKRQRKTDWTVRIQITSPKGKPDLPRIVRCRTKKEATDILKAVQVHLGIAE